MKELTRRQFLKRSLSGAGLLLFVSFTETGAVVWSAEEAPPAGFSPNAWLKIDPDGQVTVIVAKSEMGQGVSTALPMIVAEELEADWSKVRAEFAPAEDRYADPVSGRQSTGGSTSVRRSWDALRLAGAAARHMLVAAAAREWGVGEEDCEAREGAVAHKPTGRALGYGPLSVKAASLPVPSNPPLKDSSRFTIVGKPWPRNDMAAKAEGKAAFGIDTFIEGMLYAAVARPPAFGGKPLSFNEKAALAVPGARQVVVIEQGVAVLAESLPAAWSARRALDVKWSAGTDPRWSDEALDRLLSGSIEKEGTVARDSGDAVRVLSSGAKIVEAVYKTPYLHHATMEPMNCSAHVSGGECRIWAPTQNQSGARAVGASVTGLPPGKVFVHTTYLGGGFGRRSEVDYVREAVTLAVAARRPVKLIWTREEDVKGGFYRPASLTRVRGALDAGGRIAAWSHKIAVPSIMARIAPQMMKGGVDRSAVDGIVETSYEIPNLRVEWVRADAPVPVGFWRSVGNSINAFTIESFIDELAHAAGKDPLEFRLSHLKEGSRPRRLLKALAEKARWGSPLPAGRFRGVAQHFSFGTFAAHVAEVSIDKKSGTFVVHRLVAAADCGGLVNPDTAAAQLESGALMGLSAALKEKLSFSDGGVASSNFDDYPVLRIHEAPEVEAHLFPSGEALGGLGEPGLPSVAPAVANAVFAAAGRRLRELPLANEGF